MDEIQPNNKEPVSLEDIEKRLLEIDEEKARRAHNLKENYTNSIEDIIEADDIDYLDIEKVKLQFKRQFILDKRGSWKAKVLWGIISPIIVATITAYLVSVFIR